MTSSLSGWKGTWNIFSNEKTCTVDPVRNRRNDYCFSLGEENKSARTSSKTKHPASVMSRGFVASYGAVMLLIWFPFVYLLTVRDYEAKLAYKLVSWINNTLCHLSLLCFNGMVPQHTHPIDCNISCKSKLSPFGLKHVAAILARRQLIGLHILASY